MEAEQTPCSASIEFMAGNAALRLTGDWTLSGITALVPHIESLIKKTASDCVLDGSAIRRMDSAGALLLHNILAGCRRLGKQIDLTQLDEHYRSLVTLVSDEYAAIANPPPPLRSHHVIYALGEKTYAKWQTLCSFIAFIGEMIFAIARVGRQPARLRWPLVMRFVDDTGYRALPIVALLTFLVGVVLTYQTAVQLVQYNADIYIVDLSGIVILREFGPLITAIIAAGRTSTSFTAQIGTMKINEEIDALCTMGVAPIERLVLPKIIALVIALPLLAVWADIFGVVGAMVMAKPQLHISYYAFLRRFQHEVAVRHLIIGLIKAPVFALIIAAVGCFQGFQVAGTADDVGRKTTQSAVQSIFLIIIVDALFSILFSWRNL